MIRNFKFQISNFKFLILVAITIILALAISKQNSKTKPTPAASPPLSSQKKLLPPTLTEEERFLLNPPPVDASRSAKDKHAQTVAKLAKQADTLEIKDCQPTPLVLQTQLGSEVEIKNLDNIPHKITIDEEHIFEIPANGSKTIKADFKYGTGDYGYVCEGVGLVGFLHVAP